MDRDLYQKDVAFLERKCTGQETDAGCGIKKILINLILKYMKTLKCLLLASFILMIEISNAQSTNPPGNQDNKTAGFINFASDGAPFGMAADKNKKLENTTEIRYTQSAPQMLVTVFSQPETRDTIVVYLYDDHGLAVGTNAILSKNAKLIFVYKIFKKGSLTKTLDNAKGEIDAANFIKLTKLEAKSGGVVEGIFNFGNIPFKNEAGKVVAQVRTISKGQFRTFITSYSEIKNTQAGTTTPPPTAQGSLSPIAKILFKDVKCKLTDKEKNRIAELTGFVLSGKTEEPFAMDKESLDYPYTARVWTTDMNKDGIEEVFLQFGNTFTSGNTGANIVLFIKDKTGDYKTNLGFPGVEPDLLKTVHLGYPDILIGGPGFNLPIWRWNGKEYEFYKTQKQQ